MPSRADIDPVDIPRLLPDVMLVERFADGRYRYRLIGTENSRAHGMNATGRYLDEIVFEGPDAKFQRRVAVTDSDRIDMLLVIPI